ncbi:MAG: type II secretion system secretin GspD [Hyphomicrobium sp.]
MPWQQLQLPSPVEPSSVTGTLGTTNQRRGVPLSDGASGGADEPRVFKGNGNFAGQPKSGPGAASSVVGNDGVQINLVQASVAEAAKTILGDLLGANYVISDKIKFAVTIQTAKPVSKDALVAIFEAVLSADGAALVFENDVYKIVPSAEAQAVASPIRTSSRQSTQPGHGTQVIPLRHVAAPEMERILRSVAPQSRVLRTDAARNMIVVSGSRADLANIVDVVSVFDVDWMRGMSFGFFPIETNDPEAIAQELDTIFANDRDGPSKGVVRFVPNKRLKSILVISSQPAYLDKAEKWLKRIDLAGRATEKQVHVYHVQNRPAVELAQLLQRVYAAQDQNTSRPSPTLTAPRDAPVTLSSNGGDVVANPAGAAPFFAPVPLAPPPQIIVQTQPRGGAQPVTASDPMQPPPPAGAAPVVAAGSIATGSVSTSPPDDRQQGISVVPDEQNNALIITASSGEYKRIRQILGRIDAAPNQVMLEATIAEVTLNDQLRFGLRWFFEKGASEFRLTDLATSVIAPSVPGFSYFINTPNVQVALNALGSITDVNVVSSPTLMTLDNKKAILQVGNEVPVATQSAVSVVTPGAPIVNSISYRNTGVILNITPRVSDSGRVLLEIEQEVSDVVSTDSSAIDSPTFQQRRVRTTVAVQDGESIVLAGMMQDRSSRARTQVPLVGDIPLIGNLFKNKNDTIARTELLIAITPRVVKDPGQIRGIAAEFRDKLNFSTRPERRAPPDRREQVDRLLR